MSRPVESVPADSTTDIRKRGSSDKGASGLWESVRTVIALQNQAPELKPVRKDQNIPVSFNQERLWLISQLRPNTSAYNIPFAFRLFGDLRPDILEKSLQKLVTRHESLRTTFTALSPHQAVQTINEPPDKIVDCYDLRSHPLSTRDTAAAKHLKEEAQSPFNLSTGPLFRVTLLRTDEHKHILIFNLHHAIFDGWSEGILFREISVLYKSFCAGSEPPLERPRIQYADFSAWQRQWIQGDFRQALLHYWHQNLGDYTQELTLPSDRPHLSKQNYRGSHETFYLSQELSNQLKKLARQESTTLFPILLAAFKVLIYHYTQQLDIGICTPTANRNRSELKGVIGYFINMLVLRTELTESLSFRELIKQVKQSIAGANAHQDLPVQELIGCLEGSPSILSQVLFAFQNTPQTSLFLAGLEVERIDTDNGMADFELFLSLTEEKEGIKGTLKYNSDLFNADTVILFLQRYTDILKAVSAPANNSLHQPISQLLQLTDADYQKLTKIRNRQVTASPTSKKKPYLSPRNPTEEKLLVIWQDILKIQPIGVKDSFFDLGGKSMAAFELFTQIEAAFSQSLPLSTLVQSPTIAQLASVLGQQEQMIAWSPLVALQPRGSQAPFFCVHGKGGNVLGLHALANLVGTKQPFYGLQSRALAGRNSPDMSIEEMAQDYIQEIKTVQPQGPYFIGGYSLGGNIALEMAQQLHQKGEKVGLLVFLDSVRELSLFKRLLYDASNLVQSRVQPNTYVRYIIGFLAHKLNRKKTKEKSRKNRSHRSSNAPKAPTAKPSTMDSIRNRVLATNLRALKSYRPKPYLGDLTILRADKRNISQQHVYRTEKLGWSDIISGTIETYSIPSYHGKMLVQPSVEIVAKALKDCLDKSQKKAQAKAQESTRQQVPRKEPEHHSHPSTPKGGEAQHYETY